MDFLKLLLDEAEELLQNQTESVSSIQEDRSDSLQNWLSISGFSDNLSKACLQHFKKLDDVFGIPKNRLESTLKTDPFVNLQEIAKFITAVEAMKNQLLGYHLEATEPRLASPPQWSPSPLCEWDINFDEVYLLDQIGSGSFGPLFRGTYRGNVAIKFLRPTFIESQDGLLKFKTELASLVALHHTNLLPIIGVSADLPCLAIISSLIGGTTVYKQIHLKHREFSFEKIAQIAKQICAGMSFLHQNGIIHKNLRSKNIHLENGIVLLADYGIFSGKLLNDPKGRVPDQFLVYWSPELMNSLSCEGCVQTELEFKPESDVYAFGTVLYELLSGEHPFHNLARDSIIWQVSRGIRPNLTNLQTSRHVKDILNLCWSLGIGDRPSFVTLKTLFERLPRRRNNGHGGGQYQQTGYYNRNVRHSSSVAY